MPIYTHKDLAADRDFIQYVRSGMGRNELVPHFPDYTFNQIRRAITCVWEDTRGKRQEVKSSISSAIKAIGEDASKCPQDARTADLDENRSPNTSASCNPELNLSEFAQIGVDQSDFFSDKKAGRTDWRQWCRASTRMQELAKEASWSQDEATIAFPDATSPIGVIVLGDWHWGSWATDYNLIEQITDEILAIPNLYIIVAGDMEHMAIKLRGVNEVTDNMWRPKDQHNFTESWLEEIGPRILCACWDNHSVEREEQGGGDSTYRRIMSRRVIYHNGIGHPNIVVGNQCYRIALTHKFRGTSTLNPLASHMRYMRFEGTDRDIAIAADTHIGGIIKYTDGDRVRVAVNCGSVQTNSGFGKRYFSLTTHPAFPVITLRPDRHDATPYWSIKEWLER